MPVGVNIFRTNKAGTGNTITRDNEVTISSFVYFDICPPNKFDEETLSTVSSYTKEFGGDGFTGCTGICPSAHLVPGYAARTNCDFKCPPGQGPNEFGECKFCSVGRFNNDDIQNEVTRENKILAANAASICFPMQTSTCASGQEYSSASADANSVGAFEDDGNCKPCDVGKYNPFEGGKDCSVCDQGKYAANESSVQCTKCPKGTRLSDNTGTVGLHDEKTDCMNCAVGKYNPFEGGKDCSVCDQGKYAANESSVQCTKCPKGTRLSDNTGTVGLHDEKTDCMNCPVGKYNPFEGGDASDTCWPCVSARKEGASSCDGCWPGKFKLEFEGNTSCIACIAGKYSGKNIFL